MKRKSNWSTWITPTNHGKRMRWDFAIGLERVRTDAATRLQAALRRLLAIIRLHRRVFLTSLANLDSLGHSAYHFCCTPGVIRRLTRYEHALGTYIDDDSLICWDTFD